MKKLNAMLLMALCAVFSFTSCSDDDNDTGFGITGVTVASFGRSFLYRSHQPIGPDNPMYRSHDDPTLGTGSLLPSP